MAADPDRHGPPSRTAFARFVNLATRWSDNDVYGHLNNVVYYALFDSAVNAILIEAGLLDPALSPIIGLVVESNCRFYASLTYPDLAEVGVAVEHLGRSSVRYHLAVFKAGANEAAAAGRYTHVYVERATNRPVPIPEGHRRLMEGPKAPRPPGPPLPVSDDDDCVAQNVGLVARFLLPPHHDVPDRQHADELSAVHDRQMANAVFVHELLRLDHGRFLRAGRDLAGHQVANVHIRQPGSILRESAHHVALGDDADQSPLSVADRKGANVERAQPRADGRDRFFGNARRERLTIGFQDVCDPHGEPPLEGSNSSPVRPSRLCRRSWSETRPALSEACAPLIMGLV